VHNSAPSLSFRQMSLVYLQVKHRLEALSCTALRIILALPQIQHQNKSHQLIWRQEVNGGKAYLERMFGFIAWAGRMMMEVAQKIVVTCKCNGGFRRLHPPYQAPMGR
jgi:hypothetical protein